MPRVAKRQAESVPPEEDSRAKKKQTPETLIKFEQMKKEAEENRRRVRDQYLKEHDMTAVLNKPDFVDVPSSEPSSGRRKTISGTTRRKSIGSAEAKADSAGAKKTPSKTLSASKSTSASKSPSASKPKVTKPSKAKTPVKATESSSRVSSESKSSSKKADSTKKTSKKKVDNMAHLSSLDDEISEAAKVLDGDTEDWCGELYPTIALSDAFNAIGHLCAAFLAMKYGHEVAGLGFMSVWFAAMFGVLRFGVSEKLFQQTNSDLANLAGFVGYPMIGLSFAAHYFRKLNINIILISFLLVAWEAVTRSFVEKNKEGAKLITNIVFFVGPIAVVCYETNDLKTAGALLAFVLAGIVITPHHHNRVFGVRCVDVFHYVIGATAYLFAQGLTKV